MSSSRCASAAAWARRACSKSSNPKAPPHGLPWGGVSPADGGVLEHGREELIHTSVTQARRLRRATTLPERLLWNHLRSAKPKLRRQHPLGPYVLDFYCASARTVIEIDGLAHDLGDNPARDAARDAWLEAQGLTVIRIAASEVLRDPNATAEAILALCRTPPPRR